MTRSSLLKVNMYTQKYIAGSLRSRMFRENFWWRIPSSSWTRCDKFHCKIKSFPKCNQSLKRHHSIVLNWINKAKNKNSKKRRERKMICSKEAEKMSWRLYWIRSCNRQPLCPLLKPFPLQDIYDVHGTGCRMMPFLNSSCSCVLMWSRCLSC